VPRLWTAQPTVAVLDRRLHTGSGVSPERSQAVPSVVEEMRRRPLDPPMLLPFERNLVLQDAASGRNQIKGSMSRPAPVVAPTMS
jgi:hypothetical protein